MSLLSVFVYLATRFVPRLSNLTRAYTIGFSKSDMQFTTMRIYAGANATMKSSLNLRLYPQQKILSYHWELLIAISFCFFSLNGALYNKIVSKNENGGIRFTVVWMPMRFCTHQRRPDGIVRIRVSLLVCWPNMYGLPTSATQ